MKTISHAMFLGGLLLALIGAGACGSDGDDGDTTTDDTTPNIDAAATTSDAAPAAVVLVNCPPTADGDVTTDGFAYAPASTTISVGGIVHFTPQASHDVNGDAPGFTVGFAGDACLQFNEAGTFPFHCTPHGFAGTIVVQ